jgi:VWFA-related protein
VPSLENPHWCLPDTENKGTIEAASSSFCKMLSRRILAVLLTLRTGSARYIFRAFVVAVVGVALFLPLLSYSQPQPADSTTFTSASELVLIPAVVSTKSGVHISGLKKEDFVLKQDGKSHPISFFEEVQTTSDRTFRSHGEDGKFTNVDPASAEHHRLSIIVLDFVNTPFSDQAIAKEALVKFLGEVAESGEPMCLLMLGRGGLRMLHDFTDDPKLMVESVRKTAANPAPLSHEPIAEAGHPAPTDRLGEAVTKMIREQIQTESHLSSLAAKNQALLTVQGLQQIAKAFRGFPGRKALIWASAGFPFSLSSPASLMCEPACPVHQRGEVQSAYDQLWKMMNDAQIAIYSVDLRASGSGLPSASDTDFTHPYDVGDPQFDTDAQARWKVEDTRNTLQFFAENTGGRAFLGGGNLVQSFHQATQDDSSYYMLGFYVGPANTKPGWHDISVSVHARDARLRYRKGFFLSRDVSVTSARQEIQLALSSPLDYTGVPLSVSWAGREPAKSPGKTKVQFELVMPASFASIDESDQNHMVIDIVAAARNDTGDVIADLSQRVDIHLQAAGLEQMRHNGLTYRGSLQLPAGEYNVRFVVRDSLGNRTGSVLAPVSVSH